jgi:hypothetical protein
MQCIWWCNIKLDPVLSKLRRGLWSSCDSSVKILYRKKASTLFFSVLLLLSKFRLKMFRLLLQVVFAFVVVLGRTSADNSTIPVVIWHGMGEFGKCKCNVAMTWKENTSKYEIARWSLQLPLMFCCLNVKKAKVIEKIACSYIQFSWLIVY